MFIVTQDANLTEIEDFHKNVAADVIFLFKER